MKLDTTSFAQPIIHLPDGTRIEVRTERLRMSTTASGGEISVVAEAAYYVDGEPSSRAKVEALVKAAFDTDPEQ